MVEMVQNRQRRLVTSCNYPAEPGMEVFTNTERVRKIRRILVALLLARCPDVPVLQTMARQMGIEKSSLKKKGDQKCILCGLCVRFCEEVVGVSAIGLANRGTEREVATPFKTGSSVCIGCGSCSYICPTSCIEMVPDPSNAELRCLTMGSQSLSACTSSECETCSTDDEFLREMKQAVSAFRSQAGKPLP
jgi:NADH dehydrogenase/NADH:ubiquinone oxidoreductase subunit G